MSSKGKLIFVVSDVKITTSLFYRLADEKSRAADSKIFIKSPQDCLSIALIMIIDKETKTKISKLLNLNFTGDEQDWELELADESRLLEFIDAFSTNNLQDKEKYALLSLVIASYDDWLSYNTDFEFEMWRKIATISNQNIVLYLDILNYWSLWSESNKSELFNVASIIRDYIKGHFKSFYDENGN